MNLVEEGDSVATFTNRLTILTIALLTLGSPSASAHTSVVSTTPLYKTTLSEMPAELSITFTDDLMEIGKREVNTISLTAPDDSAVKIDAITIKKSTIIATLGKADYIDGTYRVAYRVVSADGHPVSGSYELYLNTPTSQSATRSEPSEHAGGFLHIHQTHIIQAGTVAIVILLWWGYRRFNREERG